MESMESQQFMQPMQSLQRTPEEKLARRRARRWKRRARIAGPFFGISLLLAALSLSVDLIEYQPREKPNRLSDRPIQLNTSANSARSIRTDPQLAGVTSSSVSVLPSEAPNSNRNLRGLDLTLPSPGAEGVPTPPQDLR